MRMLCIRLMVSAGLIAASPPRQLEVMANSGCVGKSVGLNSGDCEAWVKFFDATGGSKWSQCSDLRADPCSCNEPNANITCSATTIETLRLRSLGLAGDIAAAWVPLCKMYGLRQLDLGDNSLTGAVPETAMLNTDMNYLDLSANELHGEIPAKLHALTDLTYLNMSSNQFTGPIDAIHSLTDLITLDLSSNALSGPVTHTLACALTILQHLRLSHNRFNGTVPVFNCGVAHWMSTMHLGYNRFNGALPDTLVEMNELTELELHSNQLVGALPSTLTQITTLNALRLDGNQFTGVVPPLPFASYTAFCALDSNMFACPLPPNSTMCKQGAPTCS